MRRSPRTTVRLTSAIAAMALGLIGLTACSSDDGGTSDDVSSDEPCGTSEDTTLTVGLFGTFGFKENGLYDEYKKVCPNITVKEDVVTQSADYWTRLKTRLASGSGLADVQAIEIGFVADVVQNHSRAVRELERRTRRAEDIKAQFYDWKWQQASTPDGSLTAGLGTDIGPEAICYRSDLLEDAGMTSDPDELAKEWAHLGRLHQPSATSTPRSPARRSWTVPRASSRRPSTRVTRRTTTPRVSPTSRTATACRRHGVTPRRRLRTASRPGSRSSPTRGTRHLPAEPSPQSPAPPG